MLRPGARDVALALVLLVPGLASAWISGTDVGLASAGTVAYTLPLAFRRVAPLPVFAAVLVAVLLLAELTPDASQPTIPLAVGVAAYTVGHEVSPPRSAYALAVALVAFWSGMVATDAPAGDLVVVLLIYGAPWLFGRALRERAEQALAARGRAVEEERRRIARELHDVVSHTMSVVAVQTQAIRRRLDGDHPREVADLRAVEETVRTAMGEMRRLFGVLRADGDVAPLAPQPRLTDLDELLAEARAAGLQVTADVAVDTDALPAGLDLAVYRIVQEALTNARRHARASHVSVDVRREADALAVAVADDGRGDCGGEAGHGLVGMRERAALYGGTLTAGTGLHGRGFRVDARFPLQEPRR